MRNCSIILLGDMHFGSESLSIDSSLRRTLKSADLVIGNLESPIKPQGCVLGLDKNIRLYSTETCIENLINLNVSAVCLSNNHIMDWGSGAALGTVRQLINRNIKYVGIGANKIEAYEPLIMIVKHFKIAIISMAQLSTDVFTVTENGFGCAVIDETLAERSISKIRKEADIIILGLHWGITNTVLPHPSQIAFATKMLNAGVDIIWGHHPHVVQSYDIQKEKMVFYSLGNFVFEDYKDRWGNQGILSRANRTSLVPIITVKDGEFDVKCMYTFYQNAFLRQISNPLKTTKLINIIPKMRHYRYIYRLYILTRYIKRCVFWMHPRRIRHLSRQHLLSLKTMVKLLFDKQS